MHRAENFPLKITVITVSYNSAASIADTVRSIASQKYPNIEYLVIDGASTDGTLEFLQAKCEEVALLVSEPDQGIYDAMNKGVKFAKGDVIGFLNSDDFYASCDVLSRVAELFEEDALLEACYADLIYLDRETTSRSVRYWQSSEYVSGAFSIGWCPPHPTFFVRRSVYERLGVFDLNYSIASDVELMMRFLEVHKIRVRYERQVWVKMRLGGTTNKSLNNIWVQNQEVLRALRKHGLPADPLRFFFHKLLSRGRQFFQSP